MAIMVISPWLAGWR
uniref:Uncharacterized protein n=1 Tax=Rhizophora mucronata TaxID=61149 RepID=A0A2P2P067_RHIMU